MVAERHASHRCRCGDESWLTGPLDGLWLASQALRLALTPAKAFLAEADGAARGDLDLGNPLARPRVPFEILFAVGGWSAGSPTNFVETYDCRCGAAGAQGLGCATAGLTKGDCAHWHI